MATYLVTGGAGFIGSHLGDALLAAGHGVRVLDDLSTGSRENLDARCELVLGDVADAGLVRRAMDGAEGCFHLAAVASVARSNEDWLGAHRTNLTGSIAVFDAARAAGGVPVVYASSAAVYGDLGQGGAHEGAACAPATAYGADKLGTELHARAGFLVHGLRSVGLRFFNVYGPRQDPNSPYSGVISIFARRLAEGLPLTLHGDGAQSRDFVHVDDVVRHLLAAMRHLQGAGSQSVLNVCTGRAVSIRDLALVMAAEQGRTARLLAGPARAGDIRHSVGDPARAIAQLGVRARIDLRQGLATLPVRAEKRAVA